MFYIYEISIIGTNEVIYVGKGCGKRYLSKKKNKLLNRLMQDNECESRITHYYETEKEAFEAERQRINELKNIGQAICNNATYSTGGVGYIWTEERRKEKSVNNPMKRPEQRERMSKNNPMKNRDVVNAVVEKRRLRVLVGEKEYNSYKECATFYGVCIDTIARWAKIGKTRYGEEIRTISPKSYVEKVHFDKVDFKNGIVYGNDEYDSISDLSEKIGVERRKILYWAKRGFSSDGIVCRMKDDNKEYALNPKSHCSKRIPVVVNGIKYESISKASRESNISMNKIRRILKGNRFDGEPICYFDNQQPSRENSEKRIAEGSTTNE